jgi:hypothetical protein
MLGYGLPVAELKIAVQKKKTQEALIVVIITVEYKSSR